MATTRAGVLFSCLVLGCGGLLGSSSRADAEGDVPEGTMLWVRLEKPLSSVYSYLGESVRARTVTEVRTTGGQVVIPRGALLLGQVSDRVGDTIWIPLESIEMDGSTQRVRARFVGAENGFSGRLHAGDELMVRLDRPIWSLTAVQARRYRK